MQVVSITDERQCELVERPAPKAHGDMVIVQIEIAPMCTEYKIYAVGHPTDCLGHEAAGIVAEVAQPGRVRVGDRVVVMPQYACGRCPLCLRGEYMHCQHLIDPLKVTGNAAGTATYGEYLIKPDWLLVPIPDDISTVHGAMACCGLGPTFGAMQAMQVDAFDTVLITGMGPVGLGGVINGVYRGARVIAVESHPYRAALAKSLGATAVIHPQDDALAQVLALTDGVGVVKAIDCSGNATAQRLLLDATRRKGQVAFIAEAEALSLHISNDLIRKGLTLHGQWHYNLAATPRLMSMIRQSRELLDMVITHTFAMNQVQVAWELQLTGECGKVMLRPGA